MGGVVGLVDPGHLAWLSSAPSVVGLLDPGYLTWLSSVLSMCPLRQLIRTGDLVLLGAPQIGLPARRRSAAERLAVAGLEALLVARCCEADWSAR